MPKLKYCTRSGEFKDMLRDKTVGDTVQLPSLGAAHSFRYSALMLGYRASIRRNGAGPAYSVTLTQECRHRSYGHRKTVLSSLRPGDTLMVRNDNAADAARIIARRMGIKITVKRVPPSQARQITILAA